MTEIELEQAILDYILTLYKACYIGWLKVEKLYPGYKMSIGIPSYMFPTTVAGDWATDEDFLNYIYEDLRIRNYMRVYFYKVHRTTRNEEEGRSCEPPEVLCRPVCDRNYTDYQGIYGERIDPQPENIEDPTGSITISKVITGSQVAEIKYGALYNWYAATYNTGGASIAPGGWHVPSKEEYTELLGFIDTYDPDSFSYLTASDKLRKVGIIMWGDPNDGTDLYLFSATGSGGRVILDVLPEYLGIGDDCSFWTTSAEPYGAHTMQMSRFLDSIPSLDVYDVDKINGYSIRLIKDDSTDPGTLTDIDGNVYPTVKIGDQVWMAANLKVTHYNDNTLIPLIEDNTDWANDTTGAMCYYDNDINNAFTPADETFFYVTVTGQREVDPYEISGWVSQQEPLIIAELPFDDYVITETDEDGYTLSGIADSPVTIDVNTPDVEVVVTNAVDVVITPVKYGALYNWHVGQDLRKISSSNDWELPSYIQVVELTEYVGGGNIAGEKLKEIGGIYWDLNLIPEYPEYIPNEGTDDFGLHLRGCGFRRGNSGDVGTFENKRISFMAHMSTDPYWMMYASVYYATGGIGSAFGPDWGFSILLLRASTTLTHSQTGTYTGNDGTIYSTICIGTQEWLSVPLAETKYRNGELIPNVTNNETWAALTSGAMCYYDNDINNA